MPAIERTALAAFVGIVVLGGLNGTSIKVLNHELGPFWSASLRFGLAALIFYAIVLAQRVPLPRGRELVGSVLYGALAFGVTFALVSLGLVQAPVGAAQIVLGLVPLVTLALAVLQGVERFHLQGLIGSVIAVVGVVLVFAAQLGTTVPLLPMLAILGAVFSISEANVVLKQFPKCHPTANNAVAMTTGSVLLFALAILFGDSIAAPQLAESWIALGYLVVVGSVIVFSLFLYVITRWTASATAYAMLLMPLVAVVSAAVFLGEQITVTEIVGGAVVLFGVYVGVFAPSFARPLPKVGTAPASGTVSPPVLETPTCP